MPSDPMPHRARGDVRGDGQGPLHHSERLRYTVQQLQAEGPQWINLARLRTQRIPHLDILMLAPCVLAPPMSMFVYYDYMKAVVMPAWGFGKIGTKSRNKHLTITRAGKWLLRLPNERGYRACIGETADLRVEGQRDL